MDTQTVDRRTIRARLNPLLVAPIMAFPMIWVIGLSAAYIVKGETVLDAMVGLLLFVFPVAAIVYNFFWHYRLEMSLERLSVHKLFRWRSRFVRLDEIDRVTLKPGKLDATQIVFEWQDKEIRLMWRGSRGNWWPPVILWKMLQRLESRGVRIDPRVWVYLRNDEARTGPKLSRRATATLLTFVAVSTIVMTVGAATAATNDLAVALGLSTVGLSLTAVLLGLVSGLFWLVDRDYADLRPEVTETSSPPVTR